VKAKSILSEDTEFLRQICGKFQPSFPDRIIFPMEYEFTGEEIIERKRGQIQRQIRISDIIETNISTGILGYQSILLKTNSSQLNITIFPDLKQVLWRYGKTPEQIAEHEKLLYRNKRAMRFFYVFFSVIMASLFLAHRFKWFKWNH
jgi:hypothetical protein